MSKYIALTIDGDSHEVDSLSDITEEIVRLFELQEINGLEGYYEVDVTKSE